MKKLTRRTFLRKGIFAAAATFALPLAMQRIGARQEHPGEAPGYGRLVPAPDLRDGVRRISLPEGFSYRSFGLAGTIMSDGNLTPLAHDGMATFPLPNGNIRIIRNHEDQNRPGQGSLHGVLSKQYDALSGGGTTSLEFDPVKRELVRDFISLSGTYKNCSGGPTPWASWLSCEEAVVGQREGFEKPHGYVYEVPALGEAAVHAVPLTALGRFLHESVAVDSRTGQVYETEDKGDTSGFYRFTPYVKGHLSEGRLEMLAIKGRPGYDTKAGQQPGVALPVHWVSIPEPDPVRFTEGSVSEQGLSAGGAKFSRLEGCWYGDGSIFFNSTTGGRLGLGQVWRYEPTSNAGGLLTLIFESTDASVLKSPDHLCISPRGGLLLCEDKDDGPQYIRGLTQDGKVFDFACNIINEFDWAGATFDPTGETLFVNLQGPTSGPNPPTADPGMTLAIWGPWNNGPL